LQQAEVGPIAGLWTVGAFTDGKTVDQRAGDFVVVGPFVDQPAQLGRLVGIERQLVRALVRYWRRQRGQVCKATSGKGNDV
jgi:hypothetical protein